MNEKKKGVDLRTIRDKILELLQKLQPYSLFIFLGFVAVVYGFVLFRINTLSNAQPFESDITKQVKAAQIPHIDQQVVHQLQTLKDNSVNVQTLFEEARTNPFQ